MAARSLISVFSWSTAATSNDMIKGSAENGESKETGRLYESDVARQAELVVTEYLKAAKCSKTLDMLMSSGGHSQPSAMASELYADDLDMKKKSGAKSVLEYMATRLESEAAAVSLDSTFSASNSTTTSSSSSSSRRRSSVDDAPVEWSKEDVSQLKKAIKQTSHVEDKNDRWKQIASAVGNGKNKKHCYLKYKELKEERSEGRRSSERSSSRRSSEDKITSSSERTNSSGSLRSESKDPSSKDKSDSAKSTKFQDDSDINESKQPVLMRVDVAATAAKQSGRKSSRHKELEMQMEDCDDDMAAAPVMPMPRGSGPVQSGKQPQTATTTSVAAGRLPTVDEVDALREILFPEDRKSFSSHWEQQGFFYSEVKNLGYGLVQHEGGPCGVLAVVQAYVMRFLLGTVQPKEWRNPTQREQEQALVYALSHILWQTARASKRSQCVIALNDGKSSSSSSSSSSSTRRKFMSGTLLYTLKTVEQTQTFLTQQLRQFTEPKSNGLVLLVLSALLSKGVETVKPEMDSMDTGRGGSSKLIGGHDYCTQEMVNLLLCGVACSNVFNGRQLLEGTSEDDPNAVVLKGVPARSDVGFLSLFEAYEYICVGSHLKTPHCNVWVVCSESHYSVFFADPKLFDGGNQLLDKLRVLDIYYFDGLGNQDEEIRLTLHAFALEEKPKPKQDELIPPLNLVLQTKWPLARIDWNGVEPLL